MQITLIRHLPTEWNKKSWLQGKRNINISLPTAESKKEIEKNKRLLEKQFPFDLVLASTLKRTHQTAKLYGFDAAKEKLLDELDFGPFEGMPKKMLAEKYGEMWLENPKALFLGESLQNLEDRIVQFLNEFQQYKNILVFGHGTWIRAFLSYQHSGDINNMNKIEVKNNQCITISTNLVLPKGGR